MKRKRDKDMTQDNKFIPKEKQVIHLDKGQFIPFKQSISRDANINQPFVPKDLDDALSRQEKEDK
jgi:hypothetical protein